MGQQHGMAAQRGVRRCPQIRMRADAGKLRALDQAVEEGGDFGAALGARSVVILAADDDAVQAAWWLQVTVPLGHSHEHVAVAEDSPKQVTVVVEGGRVDGLAIRVASPLRSAVQDLP